MLAIELVLGSVLALALLFPDLPFSRNLVASVARLATGLASHATTARAVMAISLALMLFAAIWALQGDAPMFLAMMLPELAAWFSTFEIATLVEAMVAVGAAVAGARAAGISNYLKGRFRARRTRRSGASAHKPANDDEPGEWALAA